MGGWTASLLENAVINTALLGYRRNIQDPFLPVPSRVVTNLFPEIVPETCEVIYHVLKDKYPKCSSFLW
ncbi:hypothetical protein UPYG_G00084860 [Umbra pygmaea]|uniref:Uncharacterized protein n=1 Tax=Umbra pygmaea TaxID=75934 RepID=A0ABD0XEL9_UMBPY